MFLETRARLRNFLVLVTAGCVTVSRRYPTTQVPRIFRPETKTILILKYCLQDCAETSINDLGLTSCVSFDHICPP